MNLSFYKYHGTGNDFILIDNREGDPLRLREKQIEHLCHRRFGIGGDGLLIMAKHADYDFEMIYYNADGKPGSMCGNGGRCMIQFAFDRGLHHYTYKFLASDGPHEGEIDNNGVVRLKMNDVTKLDEHNNYTVLDTGSPHFVRFVNDLDDVDVVETGRGIRNSDQFKKNGINVNFVQNMGDDHIYVRTYERGVEDETFSCGTGVTAAALLSAHNQRGFNRVSVQTPGGMLSVEFNKSNDQTFEDIWLCGSVTFVYKGEVVIP